MAQRHEVGSPEYGTPYKDEKNKPEELSAPDSIMMRMRRKNQSIKDNIEDQMNGITPAEVPKDKPQGSGTFTTEEIRKGYRCLKY